MAEKLDPKEIVSLEELLMSEVIQSEALINLLDRKGIQRSNKHCAITISTQSVFRELPNHVTLNPIEPPWYVTRIPGGVKGKTREGLPMSIFKG
jgi:hypothetical protein